MHVGTDYESMTDTMGSFYPEWRADVTATGAGLVPGPDCHYHFQICENDSDPSDPLVYRVDHETVDERPISPHRMTVGTMLKTLAAA